MELESSRMVGGLKSGRLRVGAISANGALGTQASIPTRFETVLNTGVRESNAFGRRTYRFDAAENELPGPGTYRKTRSLIKQSPSISKNGTGSFLSKTRTAANPTPLYHIAPGPQDYMPETTPKDFPRALKQLRTTAKPSSSFQPPLKKKLLRSNGDTHERPGPGSYTPVDPNMSAKACAAMVEHGVRDSMAYSKPTPGPGEYPNALKDRTLAATLPERPGPSHFYSSTTTRLDRKRDPDALVDRRSPPPPLIVNQDALQSDCIGKTVLPKTVNEALLSENGGGREGRQRPHDAKKSAAFADTNLDRFGRPIVRYVGEDVSEVGPGSYQPEEHAKRMLISSAWALSGTTRDRHSNIEVRPPGPAFYDPKPLPTKLSFKLNRKDKWS